MILAIVRGTVVSSKKIDSMKGRKLLILEEWDSCKSEPTGKTFVAVDYVGAGIAEMVLCTCGTSASAIDTESGFPSDCAIIGIVDKVNCAGKTQSTK